MVCTVHYFVFLRVLRTIFICYLLLGDQAYQNGGLGMWIFLTHELYTIISTKMGYIFSLIIVNHVVDYM